MTECERIIDERILPAIFFKPETICDFYVDANRKKMWAICLDMLLQFDRICKKYGINYILGGGTLLGAIRHQGFIPWDDDIDVFMLRSEYDRLLGIIHTELPPYMEFQIPGITEGYFWGHSKLRNINTTCISNAFAYQPYNQGISIDIFPIDNCIREYAEENYLKINELLLENSANMRRSNPNPSEIDIERMSKYQIRDGNIVCREVDKIARLYNNIETEDVLLAVATNYKVEKFIYKREHFKNLTKSSFCGYQFPIPINYDEMLTMQFGDYMVLPPIEKRGTWHTQYYLEPDVSWKDSIQNLKYKL